MAACYNITPKRQSVSPSIMSCKSVKPIRLPVHPPAETLVARCQEVFEPAILVGWGGGGGGGVATFQIPLRKEKQATLECEADWERATACLFN